MLTALMRLRHAVKFIEETYYRYPELKDEADVRSCVPIAVDDWLCEIEAKYRELGQIWLPKPGDYQVKIKSELSNIKNPQTRPPRS